MKKKPIRELDSTVKFTLATDGGHFPENPLESLYINTVQTSKDMAQDRLDAWRYGIVAGWDDEGYPELMEKHGWTKEDVARNKRLHQKFIDCWLYIQDK